MIEFLHVSKTFPTAGGEVEALRDVNLTIQDGEIFGIIGMSGAGKSTLTRCINMLTRPTSGTVRIDGQDIGTLTGAALCQARRSIAMIFQSFNLLMQRNCLKNVCFPLELAGVGRAAAREKARELLEIVGLSDKALAYPAQLSGGQRQRVAIARALATEPKVLLCDEATSALDPQTTHSILSLITEINKKMGLTVIIITHQLRVIEEICTRVAVLDGGTVAECGPVSEVCAAPKSEAARRLVYEESVPNGTIRLIFRGAEATGAPLIATMAMREGIAASILQASVRSIGGKTYGQMLLRVPEGEEARALAYFREAEDVIAEEAG